MSTSSIVNPNQLLGAQAIGHEGQHDLDGALPKGAGEDAVRVAENQCLHHVTAH
jgi:hypothetical protein